MARYFGLHTESEGIDLFSEDYGKHISYVKTCQITWANR